MIKFSDGLCINQNHIVAIELEQATGRVLIHTSGKSFYVDSDDNKAILDQILSIMDDE